MQLLFKLILLSSFIQVATLALAQDNASSVYLSCTNIGQKSLPSNYEFVVDKKLKVFTESMFGTSYKYVESGQFLIHESFQDSGGNEPPKLMSRKRLNVFTLEYEEFRGQVLWQEPTLEKYRCVKIQPKL